MLYVISEQIVPTGHARPALALEVPATGFLGCVLGAYGSRDLLGVGCGQPEHDIACDAGRW